MDIFSQIWNWLCDSLSGIVKGIADILPDSPFKLLDNTPIKPYLQYINWVIPIDFMIDTFSLWLLAIAAYYTWSVLLRWIKAIN